MSFGRVLCGIIYKTKYYSTTLRRFSVKRISLFFVTQEMQKKNVSQKCTEKRKIDSCAGSFFKFARDLIHHGAKCCTLSNELNIQY